MKPLFIHILLFCIVCKGYNQNLITNPDFEQYTVCPTGLGGGNPTGIVGWSNTNYGNVDYYNTCTTNPSVGVPNNLVGTQSPHSGVAYGGQIVWFYFPFYREYFLNHLTSPLVAGEYYMFSMFISLADNTCGCNHMGAYFSELPPPYPGNINGPLNVDAQVENHNSMLNDEVNWTLITGCFMAQGGEEYVTIGNFYDDNETIMDPVCFTPLTQYAYYYLDDVSLVHISPPGTYDFDLGDPVTACVEYLIDPGIPNVEYTWEDGSHNPTLLVTQSGTYSLTLSDGCSTGVDSLEVTIPVDDGPVEIGTDQYVMCAGQSFSISLDPGAGTYEWSDGTTGPDIDITTSGTYSVTLNDDDCDFTEDQVTVIVLSPPEPFSLGGDTLICEGEDLFISLDPQLGDFLWEDGETTPDYTIFTEGTYSLTISNDCGEASDEINVGFIVPADLDSLSDQYSICNNETLTIELNPDMGNFLWQDGSNASQYEIHDPGHYTVQVTNACGQDNASFDVTGIDAPIVDLGQDQIICNNQLPVNLDAGSSAGDVYQWQDGSSNQLYSVIAGGSYSVTVTNQCGSNNDNINITVQSSTVNVSLPADQLLCSGQSFVAVNTGDTGNYIWQDNSTADTLLITTPGTYALTVNTLCGTGNDTMTLSYIPPVAIPDLGTDQSLCPSESLVLAPSNTGVSFLWQDLSTADTFLVNGPGMYFVQVSDQCTSASDTILISGSNNPPELSLPAALKLCQGDSIDIDAGITGVDYAWSNGFATSTITVSSPGTYNLTVTNACGVDIDSVIISDNGFAPQVFLGNDIRLCSGDTIVLAPTNANIDTWLWQDGTSLASYSITNAGTIIVEVSNACGTDSDTVLVSLLPALPPLNFGPDTSLCSGQSLTLSVDTSSVDIHWSDGTNDPDLIISEPGFYYGTSSNECGINSDSMLVSLSPDIPQLDLGSDKKLCAGDTIIIDPAISNVNYQWQNGTDGSTYDVTSPGTIWLIISNECGTSLDSLIITQSTDGPELDLGQDIIGCKGEIINISAGIDDVDYLWQDGSTTDQFSTDTAGIFILQVSNHCGTDTDTIQVDLHDIAPEVSLGTDTTLCDGVSLLLNAHPSIGTSIQWQDGSAAATFLVSAAGTYSLTETNHCGVDSDSIDVSYVSPPVDFTLGVDTILCPGDFIILGGPVSGGQFQWQDGSSQNSFVADKAQTYSLQISNECGSVSDDINVSFDEQVPVVMLEDSIPFCKNDILTLDATQTFNALYLWSDGSTTPSIQITSPGDYEVNVFSACAHTDQVVHVYSYPGCEASRDFFIPNLFSPNGDNINDQFTIFFGHKISITSVAGSIFDRWGNLIFYSEEIPFSWDGTFKDVMMMPGVYVYRIEVKYMLNGQESEETFLGDITMIR